MRKFFSWYQGVDWQQAARRFAAILKVVCCVVCGVMAVYLFVHRFLHLSSGFQYDELYSAATADPELSFSFIWREMLLKDVNLPLFNVLLFVWNRVFPYTFVWMHLFSALLGALAVVAAWRWAPAYWDGLKRFIFVTLMSGSFVLVCYGPIVRAYSLSVLLATIFTLQALRIIHQFSRAQNPSARTWLGFFAVGLLGAYSHFFCSGVFFITALAVFLYACYYKQGRAWAFWGTAVVFAVWSLWAVHALSLMQGGDGTWWYKVPVPKAIWEVITFLFGPRHTFLGILYGSVLALVSLGFTYRRSFLKQADIALPLTQIILLCAVVAVVSPKYNLWMDRYFLALMPSILLLLAGFVYHLYKRHALLLVLWPALMWVWVQFFWVQDYIDLPEFTGLRAVFTHLAKERKTDKLFIDMERIGYPAAAVPYMVKWYVPPQDRLELLYLSPENAPLAWQSTPKIPILMLVCSQIHLLESSVKMNLEEDNNLLVFNQNICLYTAHPLVEGKI